MLTTGFIARPGDGALSGVYRVLVAAGSSGGLLLAGGICGARGFVAGVTGKQ